MLNKQQVKSSKNIIDEFESSLNYQSEIDLFRDILSKVDEYYFSKNSIVGCNYYKDVELKINNLDYKITQEKSYIERSKRNLLILKNKDFDWNNFKKSSYVDFEDIKVLYNFDNKDLSTKYGRVGISILLFKGVRNRYKF